MELIPLLRRNLKDPEIIEILDRFDIDVIYSFDRDFENQPDSYWAESPEYGFAFRFDENQRLTTIFVHSQPAEGFNKFPFESPGIEIFERFDDAKAFVEERGLQHSLNSGEPGIPQWLRLEHRTHFVHYQFNDAGLSRVTLMLPETAPGAR